MYNGSSTKYVISNTSYEHYVYRVAAKNIKGYCLAIDLEIHVTLILLIRT